MDARVTSRSRGSSPSPPITATILSGPPPSRSGRCTPSCRPMPDGRRSTVGRRASSVGRRSSSVGRWPAPASASALATSRRSPRLGPTQPPCAPFVRARSSPSVPRPQRDASTGNARAAPRPAAGTCARPAFYRKDSAPSQHIPDARPPSEHRARSLEEPRDGLPPTPPCARSAPVATVRLPSGELATTRPRSGPFLPPSTPIPAPSSAPIGPSPASTHPSFARRPSFQAALSRPSKRPRCAYPERRRCPLNAPRTLAWPGNAILICGEQKRNLRNSFSPEIRERAANCPARKSSGRPGTRQEVRVCAARAR
ncbi:hypothetical protein BC628DRAFT_831469 [Trametes gibbosa]|nr:hypothetical protein BC628DRAFT_831469 [Trametes gibbosa]